MKSTITSLKGTVRFAFKDSIKVLQRSPKKESLIFLHFSFEGKRLKYSTGYKSCYSDWNFEKQRIKKNKSGILNADEVNEYLSKLEINLNKKYSRLLAEGTPITKKLIKDYLDNITNKNISAPDSRPLDFFEFIDRFLYIRKNDVKPVTLRSYNQTIFLLKEYEARFKKKILFESIDITFYHAFCVFLEENDYSLNTIGKHIKNIKVFLNYALLEGYTNNSRFKGIDFKVKSEQTTAIYLTEEEIDRIHKLDLSNRKELERARDIFLIGCYTGQRIGDYNGLTADNIIFIDGMKYFRIKQKKTGKVVHCPITREIKDILLRYRNLPPNKMHEQKMNDYIKQVGRMAGIKNTCISFQTKGGKSIEEKNPKYKLISSHTARRSFCTNMYRKKMPVYDIMLFSGHTTEKEFYKYIRIKDEDRASHIATSGYFNI